jgi:hypothetical protein
MPASPGHTFSNTEAASKRANGLFFQPKLTINEPNDIYEQEADATAGSALGYRWSWLVVSVDAGYSYDPTREEGIDKYFTVGASIRIGPQIRE